MATPFDFASLPGPAFLAIAQNLSQEDRLCLAMTCTQLHRASLAWFSQASAQVDIRRPDTAESLAAWLARRGQVRVHLTLSCAMRRDDIPHPPTLEQWEELSCRTLRLVAGPRPSSLASLVGVEPLYYCKLRLPTAQLAPFTALERLDGWHMPPFTNSGVVGRLEDVWRLGQLTRLQLRSDDRLLGGWAGMSGLTALRSLDVCLEQPEQAGPLLGALSALLRLTALSLDVWELQPAGLPWQNLGGLSQLQSLSLAKLSPESAPQVAAQLRRLAPSLRRAALPTNRFNALLSGLAECWHLAGLRLDGRAVEMHRRIEADLSQLGCLGASLERLELFLDGRIMLNEQRVELSILAPLTGLTHLGFNKVQQFAGWDCLAALQRLQRLELTDCDLEAVPPLPPLPCLSALDLSHNRKLHRGSQPFFSPMGGWHRLPPLAPSLASLSLQNTCLRLLPAELRSLSRLTHLDILHNKIVGGWRHLPALPALRNLQSTRHLADRLFFRPVPAGGRPDLLAAWATELINLFFLKVVPYVYLFLAFPWCASGISRIIEALQVPHHSAISSFLSVACWPCAVVLCCIAAWHDEWP